MSQQGPDHRTVGAAEVVALHGRVDAACAPALRQLLRGLVDGGRPRLVVDFSDVRFIDSSGISVLVTALKAARGAGGDVVLLRPNETVRGLLEVTRLHRVFLVFEDEADAVAALDGRGG